MMRLDRAGRTTAIAMLMLLVVAALIGMLG